MRKLLTTAGLAALVLALLFAPAQNYVLGLIGYAAVLALLGLSVTLTLGHLGFISFGQAAFFGLGAYTAGLLSVAGVPFWLAVVCALVPGVLLGVLVGYASVRVGGAYFAIATLTAAEILRLVTLNWVDVTRGPLGVMVPRPRIAWIDALGIGFQRYYTVICVLCLVLAIIALTRLLRSPWGRAWQAIREAPELAASVGVNTLNYRVANIALSGAIASLAGALLIPRILVITPELFSPMMSATALLVAIVGGVGSVIGPVLGGLVFAIFPEALRVIDQYRIAVFALLLLVMVRVQPGGLWALVPRRKGTAGLATSVLPPTVATALAPTARKQLQATLEVTNLGRSFGGLRAVHDLSFTIAPGELLGVIGPNGAGKTTCLTLISGFLAPSAGHVALGREPLSGRLPFHVAEMGIVRTFQQATLCGRLTVLDNVLIGTHLFERESLFASLWQGRRYREREHARAALATKCLALVGLSARAASRAGDLPYGEQKLLTIAVALAAQPALLLLDEPAAGLNHTEASRLADLLQRLRAQGLSLLVVDHNLRMMMKLCDRLVVMHHGQKLADGTPDEIRGNAEVQRAYLGGHGADHGEPRLEPVHA